MLKIIERALQCGWKIAKYEELCNGYRSWYLTTDGKLDSLPAISVERFKNYKGTWITVKQRIDVEEEEMPF